MQSGTKLLAIAALGCAATLAHAYEAGDVIVRAGAATVTPNDDSSQLYLNGAGIGGGATVGDDTQLGLTASYMLSSNWGIELLASTPFEHDIRANTPALANGASVPAGSTKHLPPTLSLQYYFRGMQGGAQPYVGVGVNYTLFFEEQVSSTLKGALSSPSGSSASLKLDDSVGVAAEAGIDIPLGERLVLNAAVWYIDLDTEATFRFTGGNKVTADVEIDPWVYSIGLGMKF